MDPNAALKNLRDALSAYNNAQDDEARLSHAEDVAVHAEALDEWLSKKGFLPTAWER